MLDIINLKEKDKIDYSLLILGIILFAVTPYLSLGWRGIFSIILVGLGAYFRQLKGGVITGIWVVFTLNFWGSLAIFNSLALLSQGLVFGFLFQYQANLKQDLKKKTKDLKEEKEMFNQILETTVDGFFMLDKQGQFIKTNQAYQKMTGYKKEKLLSLNINDLSLIETKEETKQHLKKIKHSGADRFESLHQTQNGGVINLEITTTYVADIKNGVYVVFARDITEKKKKEKKLQTSENKFRSYIENAPYGIFVLNSAGEYIELNHKACQLSGWSKQEILGQTVGEIEEGVSRSKAKSDFRKLKETEEIKTEFVLQKKGGSKTYLEIKAVKINENKYLGFAQDISQRKETEKKIKAERDKLRKYFELTQAIVLRLNQDKEVVEINKNGCDILGYEQEEVIGSNWFKKFVKEEDRSKSERVFRKGFEEKEIINGENTLLTKSGQEKDIFWHNNILTDESGTVIGSLSLGVDVTEIKSLREELAHSKLQMKFFANLSHELKTPLNLIFSAQQMLKLEQQKLPEEKQKKCDKYLNIISQNGNRLLRLVNNLLDINKFEADAFQLNLGNYDIVKIVENVVFSIREHIEQQNRKFDFVADVEEKILSCDPFNIERVLLNLLSNAIKFTEQGDKIKVKVLDLKKKVRIIVKDSGIGIPRQKQELVFKRFGQVDKSLTRNNEGSGMGLSIVKLIVDSHGGEIKVNSQVGVGSEFIIDLPATKSKNEVDDVSYFKYSSQELVDRINLEFADIYN